MQPPVIAPQQAKPWLHQPPRESGKDSAVSFSKQLGIPGILTLQTSLSHCSRITDAGPSTLKTEMIRPPSVCSMLR